MKAVKLFAVLTVICFALLFLGCSRAAPARHETKNTAPILTARPTDIEEEQKGKIGRSAEYKDFVTEVPLQTQMEIIPFEKYAPTIKMSIEELLGDNGDYEAPKGLPKPDTYRIVIDITHQVVMIFRKGSEGDYTEPVRYMLCSSGKHDATPIGIFETGKHHVRFGKFSIGGCAQYWSQITRRIYFHSILYNKKSAESYIKSAYNHLGTPVSHGCVRLTVPDARWIFYNIAPGTKIEIRKGAEDDVLTCSIKDQLILAKMPDERLRLIAGQIPDTDNWSIKDVPHEVEFQRGKPYNG